MIDEKEFIERLTFACYVYNREKSPEIQPRAWKEIFGNVDAMEERYQLSKLSEAA